MMYKTPDASFFLSHYPTLRETLTIPVVLAIHIIIHNLVWIMFSLLDLVPGIVFYCAGKHIQSIEQQLKEDFETLLLHTSEIHPISFISNKEAGLIIEFCNRLRQTWFKYAELVDLVGTANRTFGILMLIDHGIQFFLNCTFIFMLLLSSKDLEFDKVTITGTAIGMRLRFTTGLLQAAHLHSSSTNLKATASSLLSQHCYKMTKEEREVHLLLINRLWDHQLSACPLGQLYCVPNSILLTILSLTVSYIT